MIVEKQVDNKSKTTQTMSTWSIADYEMYGNDNNCVVTIDNKCLYRRSVFRKSRHNFHKFLYLCLILWISVVNICDALQQHMQYEPPVYASYTTTNKSINFTHIEIDPISGHIYVGASNWVYQFSANLTLEVAVQTGPLRDSPMCSPGDCHGVDETQIPYVNNINKVLVIDPFSKMLIACGSVHQGSCQRHSLRDIGQREELVTVPVASNDENSSTIALVGPAKYFSPHNAIPVLYVGATNSRLGSYRDMVPAISSRSLESGPRLFNIIEKSFTDSARVDISSHLRDYYLVKYVYGFHANDFIYFATVQRKSHLRALEEWGYISRLTRVCVSDAGFHTYTEVTLQCVAQDGQEYNLLQDAIVIKVGNDLADEFRIERGSQVLLGVFSSSIDHSSKPDQYSAVCVFPLSLIEHKFTQNIHLCYNGSVLTRNMDYIAGSVNECPEPGKAGNIQNFCNEAIKLNGSLPITSTAIIVYQNTTLTAVTATVTGQHTVAFVGTSDGAIKKILISGSTVGEEFEDVIVDRGHPILGDIHLDHEHHPKYVIASSPYKISKVKIERCTQYHDCDQCLAARNPYCGWCSLEKRCTVKSECNNATNWGISERIISSPRWLSLETTQCIDFQAIKPEFMPYNTVSNIELLIYQLPQLPYGANYLCVFGVGSPIPARVSRNGLSCMAPSVASRPAIPPGEDHTVVNLAVRSSETDTDFINRSFVFYDCSVHKTCKSCVTSSWACNWCMHENMCTHNTSQCARRMIVGENSHQNSLIKGRQHCPSFSIDNEILIPNGAKREITIEVRNLISSLEGFQCIVEIEGAKERVFARVRDNKVICAESVYTYEEDVGEMKGELTVLWNGDTFIDKTNVTLYKCHLLGSHASRPDCSLCQTRDKKYQCVWCSSQCSYVDSCVDNPAPSCPPPRIDWIHPLSGPVEGGTLVAIEGSNLGLTEDEIRDKVALGGIPCVTVEYSISVRVVCRTGVSPIGEQSAVVVIGNRAGVTRAQEKFQYKTVHLMDVNPKLGPQSGGTRLYLSGTNLNIGSNIEIFLDELPCRVERSLASSKQLSCRTTPAPHSSYSVRQLILCIDGSNHTLSHPFKYTKDPTIYRIYPLESFFSGGRPLLVSGSNFTSIQLPRIAIFDDNSLVNETSCNVINSTTMSCPSPKIMEDLVIQSQSRNYIRDVSNSGLRLRIGFVMDDVQSVRDLQEFYPTMPSNLIYLSDPKVFSFDENGIKLYKGESLVIEGENLRLASTEHEVNVTIGTRTCNITSLSMTQLVCFPPDVQPLGSDELGRPNENDLPTVVVKMGNLRYDIGYLRYEVSAAYELPPLVIGCFVAAGAVLMLLSLIVLAIFKHKSSQAEREYKRIQLQMDTLENSVRSECKQAFAELQTDMTDLNNDLQTTGIPTLDHRAYIIKVFFPGLPDNGSPLSSDYKHSNGNPYNSEESMAHFEQLIYNRNFLLVFIETLENQKSFTIRDKVNVASLLMIILMEKMDYAFDILRELLIRLIQKYVSSKHPQLLLRRTESVVEKLLTNWMSLCMYKYINEVAGSSLFLLFNAIKHQIEKGPIDYVTHDSRYSLSEERLLREQVDYMTVVIHVIQEGTAEKIQCRVLNCDTISQVKSKIIDTIYKNVTFSQRPTVNEVNLEWRHGRGGHLILADEDLTTKVINGWKRLNTLSHYGIKDMAVMGLIIKERRSSNHLYETIPSNSPTHSPSHRNIYNTLTNNYSNHYSSNYSHYYSTINSNSTRVCDDSRVRTWHLVKPFDDNHTDNSKDQLHKQIPEIYLTRLLSTKGTIQKYVDDFLSTILTVNDKLPLAVKWLFDLLDTAAANYGITDHEVIHAWKSNSLPLRFWVNLVKNPDFLFDIEKSSSVDACLSVIAQTFMDSCSTQEHRLGKDSPSNKLLFARDIPVYRKMVSKYYADIASLPPIHESDVVANMNAISQSYAGEVDTYNALRELYIYVSRYREPLFEALCCDPQSQRQHLHLKLETIAFSMGSQETMLV
ncbi:plexin-B-like [Oppia nitens]|uniref:plexin-B-like n=1 Tax=Oppia nitens TaxID=1686743 RepID=UPI0023DADD82|nr:plexin-B-like [Oppia nitens]XP_054164069.1 plexin-B-like [Oppia nitens]